MNLKNSKDMKLVTLIATGMLMIFLLSAMVSAKQTIHSKVPITPNAAGSGFAVVELFTSEGCSSCPPADALLARVQQEAGDKPIYLLSFHVDYWNRLGWKDAFSDADFTRRQYNYSNLLATQVYTPQAIVNGKVSFVGSDEASLTHALASALQSDATTQLNIRLRLQPEQTFIDYTATGTTRNDQLVIAVVQKHAVSNVKRGENGGRTLAHVQIVRSLFEFPLHADKQRSEKISLPAGFNTQEWEVIGMIQNTTTGKITAAGRATIPAHL